MGSSAVPNTLPAATPLPPDLSAGLALLLQAHDCAEEHEHGPWEFAVELSCLRSVGVSTNAVRWLVSNGHAEHAIEITVSNATRRTFQAVRSLALPEGTCLILTARGVVLARTVATAPGRTTPMNIGGRPVAGCDPLEQVRPRWDQTLRELWCGEVLIKEFRRPAPNQELVLSAFEEEGWPRHIDDPLPGRAQQDAKQRLHDTINRLNRHQRHHLIAFRGDGVGSGVRWHWLPAIHPTTTPGSHRMDT
jgi:hypothetical protein